MVQAQDPAPLEEILMHDRPKAHLIPGSASSSKVYECPLETSGRTAFHKPVDGMTDAHPNLGVAVFKWYGHVDQWVVLNNEVAAWRLAHALGSPWDTLVATSVARWVRPTGAGVIGGWGAFTRKGEGPSGHMDPLRDPGIRNPAAFFDSLIGNQDRNASNYRFGSGVLTLFDHGFSFPGGQWLLNDSLFLRRRHSEGDELLSVEEAALLFALPTTSIWGELGKILRDDQFYALDRRRTEMLKRNAVLKPESGDLAPN